MIRPVRIVNLYCIFPKNLIDTVAEALQDLGMVHIYDIKEASPSLQPLESNREFNEILKNMEEYIKEIGNKPRILFEWLVGPRYAVIESKKMKKQEVLDESRKLLEEIRKKFGQINSKNAGHARKLYYARLLALYEHLQNLKEKSRALEKFGATKYTASFSGFVEKEELPKVLNALDTKTKSRCAFEVKDADSKDNPPTKLSNNWLIRPFEILTENYGMPQYNGIDPTIILAVTFTLFFGFMFPDVGYGIILAMISIIVYFMTRKTTKFIRNFNIILIYCGISSVFFGLLFGEFFGKLIQIKPFLFEPAEDIAVILIISVAVGVVHMSIGILSSLFIEKNKLHHFGMLLAIWSIILILYTRNIAYMILFALAVVFVIASKGLYAIEEVASIFSHILSYLRIGILSTLSIILSRLLVDAVAGLPEGVIGIFFGLLLVAVGILFSFIIGLVSVFIQSLRLHWLEFFSSYEFGGRKFEPFGFRKEYLYN